MSPTRPVAAPPELPGYSYIRLLGSGGFADVYLFQQELPWMPVAVKVLVGGVLTRQDERRFTAEANTMARFSSHPYIVGILNAAVASDGRPYIVMQYYPKDNLAVRCRRRALTVADALQVGIQVASAVETAHRAGVLHRDIKPANILTGEFGDPGLTDFGIAAATAGTSSTEREGEGFSIPWSPPEAFDSDAVLDERSDIYSLGATVYNLLSGRSPFEEPGQGNSAIHLMERIQRRPVPPLQRGDVPVSLSRVLAQSMAKQPERRHTSAMSFARDLQAVEQELHLKMTAVVVPDESVGAGDLGPDGGADETRGHVPQRINPQAGQDLDQRTRKPSIKISRVPGSPPVVRPGGSADSGSMITSGQLPVIPQGPSDAYPALEDPTVSRRGASGIDLTGTRKRPSVDADDEQDLDEPVPEASPNRTGIILGAAAVVVVVIVVLIVSLAGPSKPANSTSSSTTTTAPFIDVTVPVPEGVVADVSGTTATLTWTDPDRRSGDFFTVFVTNAPGALGTTTTTAPPQTSHTKYTFQHWASGSIFCAYVELDRSDGYTSDPSKTACSIGSSVVKPTGISPTNSVNSTTAPMATTTTAAS